MPTTLFWCLPSCKRTLHQNREDSWVLFVWPPPTTKITKEKQSCSEGHNFQDVLALFYSLFNSGIRKIEIIELYLLKCIKKLNCFVSWHFKHFLRSPIWSYQVGYGGCGHIDSQFDLAKANPCILTHLEHGNDHAFLILCWISSMSQNQWREKQFE